MRQLNGGASSAPPLAGRKNAPIELPHVMLLTDDPERTVIEPLAREKAGMEQVYDFDLMERGGHLAGWKLGRRAALRRGRRPPGSG